MSPIHRQQSQSPKASPQPKSAHLSTAATSSPSHLSSTAPTPSPNPDPPPKPFSPLFTLLTSHPTPLSPHSTTTTTHHPTIHYLFSDDNSDLLTSAALSTLEPPPSPPSSPTTASPTQTQEHFLIIDLDDSGTKVTSAHSMSPHWAITAAETSAAPTWGEELDENEAGEGKRGLMLKIEGVEAPPEGRRWKERDDVGGRDVTVEELEGLAERFQRGLEGLRRVVEVGARWEGGGDGE